jgi:hypothetical protein
LFKIILALCLILLVILEDELHKAVISVSLDVCLVVLGSIFSSYSNFALQISLHIHYFS